MCVYHYIWDIIAKMNKRIKDKYYAASGTSCPCHKEDAEASKYEVIYKKLSEIVRGRARDGAITTLDTFAKIRQTHAELLEILRDDDAQFSISDEISYVGEFYNNIYENNNQYARYIATNFPEDLDELLQYIGTIYVQIDFAERPDNSIQSKNIIELIFKNNYIFLSSDLLEVIIFQTKSMNLQREIANYFFSAYSNEIKSICDNVDSIMVAKFMMEEFRYDINFSKLLRAIIRYYQAFPNHSPPFGKLNFGDESEDAFFFSNLSSADLDDLPIGYMKEIYKSRHLEKFLNINLNVIDFKKMDKIHFILYLNRDLMQTFFDMDQLIDIVGIDMLSTELDAQVNENVELFLHNAKFTHDFVKEVLINARRRHN